MGFRTALLPAVGALTLGLALPAGGQEPPSTQLTHTLETQEHSPAWSSDGSQIAFFSNLMDGEGDIWMMPASGEPETRLTTNPYIDNVPSWSPVGAQIAFYTRRAFGPGYDYDIWVLTVGGGEERLTTTHSGQEFSPAGRLMERRSRSNPTARMDSIPASMSCPLRANRRPRR